MTLEEARRLVGDKWQGPGWQRRGLRADVEDWLLNVSVLEAVGALGYHKVWNWHILDLVQKVNDVRLIPIVLEKLYKYKVLETEGDLIQGLAKPMYKAAVPALIERYKSIELPLTPENEYIDSNEKRIDFRHSIAYTLSKIKCKDYSNDYLELITNKDYVLGCDEIIVLLCRLKERRAIEPMLSLLEKYPKQYKWDVLGNIGWYRDPELIKYVEPFLKDSDGEFRQMAKRAIEWLMKGAKEHGEIEA